MTFSARKTAGSPALRFVEQAGEGPAMLMLHGVTRCAEDFRPLFGLLTPGTRVSALDQRGHGGSDRAARYLVIDYVSDAADFVRRELARPVVLYGHSLGAMVAAAVAAEVPELVRGVVLEDPPFRTTGSAIHGSGWQVQFNATREIARRGGTAEQMTGELSGISLPVPGGGFKRLGELRDRASLEWSAQCLKQVDPEVLTPVVAGGWMEGYDTPGTLARIACPALVLQADVAVGGALADEDADLIRGVVPACKLVRFPRSGHLLHWLQPERVAALANDFLATVAKAR